jgi:hypothetical protein
MTSSSEVPRRPAREGLSGPLLAALLLAVAFLGGAVAGFAVRHEPRPEVVGVRLEAGPEPAETIIRGTLSAVTPTEIELTDEGGPRRLELPAGTPIEELSALGSAAVTPGAPANLGGTRTETGFVLGGVVLMPDGSSGGPEVAR